MRSIRSAPMRRRSCARQGHESHPNRPNRSRSNSAGNTTANLGGCIGASKAPVAACAGLRRLALALLGCPAMLAFLARGRTHFARCARCVQTSGHKSEQEARGYARGQQRCASRRRQFALPRPRPAPRGRGWFFSVHANARCWLARGRCGVGATVHRREAKGFWPRAYPHASSSDSQLRFDHSERSERRALCSGPEDRASQGTLSMSA